MERNEIGFNEMDQWSGEEINLRLAAGRPVLLKCKCPEMRQRRQQVQLNELRQHRVKLNAELQAVENEIKLYYRYSAEDCAKTVSSIDPRFNQGMAGAIGSVAQRVGPTNEDVVRHHAPDGMQIQQIKSIRLATRNLMDVIDANSPRCADQSAAKRAAREAMMWANAAIVLNGAV